MTYWNIYAKCNIFLEAEINYVFQFDTDKERIQKKVLTELHNNLNKP